MYVYVCVCGPMPSRCRVVSSAALPSSSVSCVVFYRRAAAHWHSVLLHSLMTCSVSFGQNDSCSPMDSEILSGAAATE